MLGRTEAGTVADPVREARIALRTARYDLALSILGGCEDWDAPDAERAVLLKAETLGRRDPIGALEYLTAVDDVFETVAGRFGRDLEGGRYYAAVRDFDSAAARYAAARKLAALVPDGIETMAYHDLRMRWFRRECDPDAPEIGVALGHPDPSYVAATLAHRGWLHAGRGDYRLQIDDFCAALACVPLPDEPLDVATLAFTTHALARVAFEIADADGVAIARTAFESIAWTPDVQVAQFETLRAFGWDAFMRGEAGRAQWTFKDARAIAPSPAWQVLAHLDRAYVARIARNEIWSIEELGEADRVAREIRWESTFGEERQILVVLAALHARVDAGRAQHYAATYRRLGTESVNPALAIAGDKRAVAAARYAQGLIDQTLGRSDAAVPALAQAYEIYASADHHFRATLAAAALAELTGEERWRVRSIAHAARYPDCPLASVAERSTSYEDAMPQRLSPLQRQIARALWTGADVAELSRRFSRSLYTIERQVAEVFNAFGVATRGELLTEARGRGLA